MLCKIHILGMLIWFEILNVVKETHVFWVSSLSRVGKTFSLVVIIEDI